MQLLESAESYVTPLIGSYTVSQGPKDWLVTDEEFPRSLGVYFFAYCPCSEKRGLGQICPRSD